MAILSTCDYLGFKNKQINKKHQVIQNHTLLSITGKSCLDLMLVVLVSPHLFPSTFSAFLDRFLLYFPKAFISSFLLSNI